MQQGSVQSVPEERKIFRGPKIKRSDIEFIRHIGEGLVKEERRNLFHSYFIVWRSVSRKYLWMFGCGEEIERKWKRGPSSSRKRSSNNEVSKFLWLKLI